MKINNDYITIEDFILDDDFVKLVEKNEHEEITSLCKIYPDKAELITQAVLLIKKLKIEEHNVSQEQITDGFDAVMEIVNPQKKRKVILWAASAVASIAALFVIYFNFNPSESSYKEEMLFVLNSGDSNTEDVQIISGDNQIHVKNEETIKLTEEGDLIIGDDKKIESNDIKSDYIQLIVPNGRRTKIKFNDGTMAWVNSGSKLLYPKQFKGKNREIFVDGEIYLEVAPDESRPFYAHTAKFDVKVLGTQFNISAYSSDKENSVVLVQGSVEVSSKSGKNKIVPNQGVFLESENTSVKGVDIYQYICWKDGIMVFDGESLGTVMQKLSRYYRVEIRFERQISDEPYKGKLTLNDSLEDILYNLSRTASFTYTKDGNTIYIK